MFIERGTGFTNNCGETKIHTGKHKIRYACATICTCTVVTTARFI